MKLFLPLALLLFPICLQAQFTYVLDQSIPVQDESGTELTMPWAGGLNASQYNTIDLNNDGKEDLVLFDRMANKILTFLNQNNVYRYAPAYEAFFPEGVTNWVLLRDHNCDGKKDIFTGDILGIKVYTNVSTPEDGIAWEPFLFYSGPGGLKTHVLLTEGFSSQKINLQLQFDDLPAIVDADGDGDLDIFSIRYSSNGTIEFHQNMSQERYGSCDSLDFKRMTTAWGGITECSCGIFAFNNEECPSTGRTKHAGGKSLLAMDADGDSKLDIILSEATCTNLYLLKNEGDVFNPVVNSATAFPFTTPTNIVFFPAGYYEDVDFDGKKDFIASPNIYSREYFDTNLQRSNWFYKNTGTTTNPVFAFVQNDFLQKQMIDVGDNAVPAFADSDGDGDYDLFISQHSTDAFSGYTAALNYFENTGTPDAPSFSLQDTDLLGFRSSPFYNLKIQFADMNNDRKIDLVFTATSFNTRITGLYYILNTGSGAFNLTWDNAQSTAFTMYSTENIFVTDVNHDGLPDLLHGTSSGALQYWKNTGSSSSPNFVVEDEDYLGIGSSVLRQNLSSAIADLDADGKADLLLGDQTGKLRIISNFSQAENTDNAIEDIVYNSIAETYQPHNLGGRIWPTVINLFKTDKPTIIVGNILGGVSILKHDGSEALPETPNISIYPNPVQQNSSLSIKVDRPAYVQFFSSLGQQLNEPLLLHADEVFSFKIPGLAPGIYIFRFTADNKVYSKRVVIY